MPGIKKRRAPWLLAAVCLLAAAIVYLTISMAAGLAEENREYQFVADLGGLEYDQGFLDTAAKIKGIRRVSPVLELSARLKLGDYTMDTILQAMDIEALDKKVLAAREAPMGDTPVLLLGKDSLGEMRDFNGHAISGEQQKRFLKSYENLEAELLITSGDAAGEEGAPEQWKTCIVAGILEEPAGGIYISFEQGEALAGNCQSAKIEKVLLTVRGKENYEKAQNLFS